MKSNNIVRNRYIVHDLARNNNCQHVMYYNGLPLLLNKSLSNKYGMFMAHQNTIFSTQNTGLVVQIRILILNRA